MGVCPCLKSEKNLTGYSSLFVELQCRCCTLWESALVVQNIASLDMWYMVDPLGRFFGCLYRSDP